MDIRAYLNRIGYKGNPAADLKSLAAIHRAHALSIPYENLDVQLNVPVTRAPRASFDKIVGRRRGGWCYEMNGLLGWALEEIGFEVRRLAGAVMREAAGDANIGNHLVLLITLEGQQWIGDVGFGDGLIEPAPLREGDLRVGPLNCRLSQLDDGWWRYSNDPRSGGPSFDFNLDVSDEGLLEDRCNFLQTNEASPFVQNAVVQRWREDAHYSMRGKVLRVLSADREERTTIKCADDYVATLREVFSLDFPEAASLWPRISARHEEVFGA